MHGVHATLTMASFKFAFLLFTLWALAILGTASAINSCSLDQGAYQLASHCPQDGNEYLVCLSGPSLGGCRLRSKGDFGISECATECLFQS
ncbi:hypothetical protein WJX75_008983 [Coccomyxa subellipsoidea]|uniref:Secreted protein n=1 Tax=Coccomyxa subellipsoidea TaxID=248742 RepID=A0ABR2YN90_9CHLO